jgi:hypothetical protein
MERLLLALINSHHEEQAIEQVRAHAGAEMLYMIAIDVGFKSICIHSFTDYWLVPLNENERAKLHTSWTDLEGVESNGAGWFSGRPSLPESKNGVVQPLQKKGLVLVTESINRQ